MTLSTAPMTKTNIFFMVNKALNHLTPAHFTSHPCSLAPRLPFFTSKS